MSSSKQAPWNPSCVLCVNFNKSLPHRFFQAEEERQRKQLLFEGVGVADLGQSEDWATFPSTSRPQGYYKYFLVEFDHPRPV